jgi:cyclohexanone monooxygenase
MFSEELEQDWRWSERYATQPEILRYINHVADRFDLRRDVELSTRMERATWDDQRACWAVEAADGRRWESKYLIMAVGQLSQPKYPSYPGQEDFTGRVLHSAEWPKAPVQFEGQRVAIIGTGSSGVQMTPIIAEQAAHLAVFQRTANFSIPAANAPVTDEEDAAVKANYRNRRGEALNSPSGLGFKPNKAGALSDPPEVREQVYEAAWNRYGFGFALAYHDVLLNEAANDTAADFIRRKIAAAVENPLMREKLTPKGFPFGARRPSVDSGYLQAFNRDNVELVDIRSTPIERFTAHGIRTTDGVERPFDIIIYATGFDAFTGSLLRPEIIGRGGITLRQKWSGGPITYLGLGSAGFPNLFIIVGPGSPSLLSNVLLSTEQQVDWLTRLLDHARAHGFDEVEVTEEAERDWVQHVNARAEETLYPKAASYYMGAEIEGKPRVFMPYSGGVRGYRRILEQVATDGYRGFALRQRGDVLTDKHAAA